MLLLLFDIDGTLVDSNDFDTSLYLKAVYETLGINIYSDWNTYDNVTDSEILFQVLKENNLLDSSFSLIKEVKKRFLELVEAHIGTESNRIKEIPGAKNLIRKLSARDEVIIGIATGGWEETAKIKLNSIGIDPDQFAMSTSTDSPQRIKIMKIAEKMALQGRKASRIVYFGDGNWDKKASQELRYEFIGVGNKVNSEHQVPDFQNQTKLFTLLGLK